MGFSIVTYLALALVIVNVDSRSIGTSENNVTKRETRDDPFPDWVPFKNKHGEELGEFLQVETVTKKPKKRLALPMNFLLKPVADPEPQDYFEKGLESDGEDYYEKREWSDAPRSGKADTGQSVNHTEISDIEGVVGILTGNNAIAKPETKDEELPPKKTTTKTNEDYSEEEEEGDKQKTELTSEERTENERKKALILDSVDELKERHEHEQKLISEKIKEEAMHTEERDRDDMRNENYDKYNQRSRGRPLDYGEYDNKYEDKYRITPLKKPGTPPTSTIAIKNSPSTESTSSKSSLTGRMSVFRNPSIYMIYDEETTTELITKSTKGSTMEIITPTPRYPSSAETTPDLTTKHHDKNTTPLNKLVANVDERISLVPQDNELREGEPTLFFPKKTKRRNSQKSAKDKDSHVSASSPNKDVLSNLADAVWAGSETAPSGTGTGSDLTAPSSGRGDESGSIESEGAPTLKGEGLAQNSKEVSGSGETAASAPAGVAKLPASPVDAISASSDHKEDHKGEHNHEHEKGGEQEHHSEHHSEHGESGKKAYEGFHEDKKTSKGHHDKEDHLGKYHDAGGSNKEHHDENKHYGAHHHEEHGKKHAEYEESGKHSKGHSTKGSHDIHKKEEYEKKVEFFEEEGDSAEQEKHGGHTEETGHKKGGKYHKGHDDAGHHSHAKGDSGQFLKGGHLTAHRGHSSAAGHNLHGKHVADKFMEGGKKSGKKWIYHHGSPAKNANLVVIDRRGDQLYHGPQYYG